MVRGITLSSYFTARFLRAVLLVFGTCTAIILLLDFVELTRKAGDKPEIGIGTLALLSALRVPSLAEQLFPFAILFGAMAAILGLSRKLELVIARASGVSVWQFIAPLMIASFVIGLAATMAYNPIAASFKDRAEVINAELFGAPAIKADSSKAWLRQKGERGESVVRAGATANQGEVLSDVTIFSYDENGRFEERIEARKATLNPGYWQLEGAWIKRVGAPIENAGDHKVSTEMRAEHIRESFASPTSVSFWRLPQLIGVAQQAGLPAFRYRLQYQSLLARPLLFCAMVLIAATVSMRVFRFGNVGRMILGGIIAGFVLYIVSELAEDFGGAGIVHPAIAAWSPAIVASLFGLTVLLHQEDG